MITLFKGNSHSLLMPGLVLTFVLCCGLSSDSKAGCLLPVEPIYSVDEFDDVRCKDMSSIELSDRPNLPATLWFNQGTIWPESNKMPPGCDPNEIMTKAINPGLGIRSLHQQGITGLGVNVAIIDQPMYLDHPEFSGKIAAYYDTGCGGIESSMHGPSVSSLLVGTNCGTAPAAQVYYAAAPSWTLDAAYYADALDWIVAQNESLPASEKIRVVSVSAAPSGEGSPFLYNNVMWDEACSRSEAAGILIIDCTNERRLTSRGWYDPNDPENIAGFTAAVPGYPPPGGYEGIYCPVSRTMAEENYEGDFSYHYTCRGGLSWTVPYCTGVLAMGWQIQPELTGDKMVDLLFLTAYTTESGAQIINPPAFIALLEANQPTIELSTQEFVFFGTSGGAIPDSQTLSICNSGLGILNWVISENCSWLDVNPDSGTSTGPADINDITLTVTDITPGVHNCELIISDPCATNGPQKVLVTLYAADGNSGTIQAAIDAAQDGDTIVIAPGVYLGNGNCDIDFKGKAITVSSTDPNNPDIVASTIVVCQGSEAEKHRGFYFHSNETADSVLDGFTITGGYEISGGAIYCNNSSPTIRNCVLVDNSADIGGGMRNVNSNPIVVNCIFKGNSAVNWGGGMTNRNCTSSLKVTNCTFTDNMANWGGGMRNYNANPTVINCIFTGNIAQNWGGGMDNIDESNPAIINCTFNNNSAVNQAGGIFNRPYVGDTSTSTLANCILWGNSSGDDTDESAQISGNTPVVNYSCIQGWTGGFGGTGNIGSDPRFAAAENGDYHLKSEAGRWKPSIYIGLDPTGDGFIDMSDFAAFAKYWQQVGESTPADLDNNGVVDLSDLALLLNNYLAGYLPGNWILDDVTSPCIDAGNPMSPIGLEPFPNGGIINMGAYGGTEEASKS